MAKKDRRIQREKKKPYLGRIPIPPPDFELKDKKKYNRKKKHKFTYKDLLKMIGDIG